MNGRKAKERARRVATERRRAARFKPDDNVGVMFGHCTYETDVEGLKKILHDNLIRMMGERRTGGVRWLVLQEQDARDFLTQMAVDGEDAMTRSMEWKNYVRQCRARLREYGGFIVSAMAEGNPQEEAR